MQAWNVLLLAAGQPAAAIAVPVPPPDTLSFSIRADPSVAEKVDALLAELAKPTRTRVPAAADAAETLSGRCGGFTKPVIISSEPDPERSTVTVVHQPCLLFRRQRDFVVKPGYTVDSLAMASGLRPSSSDVARVQKKGGTGWEKAETKTLGIGDKVRFTNVPSWTRVQFDTARIRDRADLIVRIGALFDCPADEIESCVQKRGIDVADDNAPEVSGAPSGSAAADEAAGPASPGRRAHSAALGASVALALQILAAPSEAAALQPEPSATVVPEDARAKAPVAPDQWPYDRALVAATLAADQQVARQVIVGVADAGLGNAAGMPLPSWIFSRNSREEDPEPDGNDDDEDGYVDDLSGAGVARTDIDDGNGDLGLCAPPGIATTLTGEKRATADHGAIVSSIASGYDIYHGGTGERLSVGLPRLVFFRMLGELCGDQAPVYATEAGFLTAMDYVYERAPILVVSYTFSNRLTPFFQPSAKNYLENLDKLLIVPAGNDGPGDLDQGAPCPACLAAAGNGIVATRTLVVGTALRDLTIAPFSNWGKTVVPLYAPGETSRAIDVVGHNAAYPDATSWSAPYAGLAAGIIQSLGLTMVRDLRERLIGSAWPIIDPDGKTDPANSGIINITAAASVRHAAIEVVEKDASGNWIRRTYVGSLDTPKADLCSEEGLGPVHSVRIGPLEGTRRKLTKRLFTWDSHLEKFPIRTAQCTLPDQIRFTDLVRGSLAFDSSAVTQILFPWPL